MNDITLSRRRAMLAGGAALAAVAGSSALAKSAVTAKVDPVVILGAELARIDALICDDTEDSHALVNGDLDHQLAQAKGLRKKISETAATTMDGILVKARMAEEAVRCGEAEHDDAVVLSLVADLEAMRSRGVA